MGEEQPLEFANVGAYLREALAESKRYSITHVDPVGVIERFTSVDAAGAVPQWAQLVREQGLEPGDRVVVLAGRAWEWRCALLGVLHAGGIAVPCPEAAPAAELREIAEHTGAKLVVAIPSRPDLAEPDGPRVLSADQLETVDAAEALVQLPHRSMPGDVGIVLYARKATGLQGTMHTHASLIAQAEAGDHWLGIREGERVWCNAVDGSVASIWLLLAAWGARGNIVTVDLQLDPEAQLELLERLRPAALWFSDEDYGLLASADAPAWIDLGPIRRALLTDESSAGAVAFADAFGTKVTRLFGQTEVGVVAGWPAGEEHDAVAETAMPVPDIPLAVVDEQGSELPPGEEGEVVVRGDAQTLFKGYVGDEPPRRDSWLRLGWRGALGADRSLRLASRAEVEVIEAEVDLPVPELVDAGALAAFDELPEEPESTSRRSKREAKRARRREEREAKNRQKDEERRRREEEKSRELAERAAAKERKEAERSERKAAEAEAPRRAADEKRHEQEQAEERRRAEEAARAEREAAEAEQRRQAEEAARAEERRREEEERQRAEEAARAAREAAEAEERRRAEETARAEREAAERAEREAAEAAEAEARRRAEEEVARAAREAAEAEAEERRRAEEAARAEELRREEEETRGGRRRRREEKRARRREEQEAKERQKAEAAERAQREAEAAEERRRAEEAARVEERRRAEEEKRRERERRREEKEARRREEQQAKEAARAQRKAARGPRRRRATTSEPEPGQHDRQRQEAAEQSEQEQLSREIVSRIKQYGMTTPPADPEEPGPADAEASTESHVAAEPNERREPE